MVRYMYYFCKCTSLCPIPNLSASLYTQGKLKYNEQVTEGFEHIFDAFLGLFTGENTGKAVVKA